MGAWDRLGISKEQYDSLVQSGPLSEFENKGPAETNIRVPSGNDLVPKTVYGDWQDPVREERLERQRELLEKNRSYEGRKQVHDATEKFEKREDSIERLMNAGLSRDEAIDTIEFDNPEPPVEDEGFFDFFRPLKDKLLKKMGDEGMDEKTMMAFDLMTPDGPALLSYVKKLASSGSKVARIVKGDKDVAKVFDFKTGKPISNRSIGQNKRHQGDFEGGSYSKPVEVTPEAGRSRKIAEALGERDRMSLKGFSARFGDDPKYEAYLKKVNDAAESVQSEPYLGKGYGSEYYSQIKPSKDPIPVVPVFGKIDPKGEIGRDVAKGGADPFAWVDNKYGLTKNVMKENYDKPMTYNTKSDLISHDDYIELINPDTDKVNFHVSALNKRLGKIMEGGNANTARRLDAIKKLRSQGIDTTIVLDFPEGIRPELFNDDFRIVSDRLRLDDGSVFKVRINKLPLTDEMREKMKRAFGSEVFADGK